MKKKKAKHRRPAKGESCTSSKRVNRVEWIQSNLAVNHRHSHGSFVYIFRVPISDFSRRTVTPMFFSPRKPSTTTENNFDALRDGRGLYRNSASSHNLYINCNYIHLCVHTCEAHVELVRIIWGKMSELRRLSLLLAYMPPGTGIRGCQVASKYLLI